MRGETSEKKLGSEPSSPIAIITREAFRNTTLAIPNPPQMKPTATRIVDSQLSESIATNTLTLGEYTGAMPPELYANANWLRKSPPAMCCSSTNGSARSTIATRIPGRRKA